MRRIPRIPTRPARPGSLAVAVLAVVAGLYAGPANAVDPGEARVLSMQGQKLKVEIPYASAPGEPVSAVHFSVVATTAEAGQTAPVAGNFTIMQPLGSNRIILRSAEPVHADSIDLVLGMGVQPGPAVRYRLNIPR